MASHFDGALLRLAAALVPAGLLLSGVTACNGIFGIDAGHLVGQKKDSGAGGEAGSETGGTSGASTGGQSGAGGSNPKDSGAGGANSGGANSGGANSGGRSGSGGSSTGGMSGSTSSDAGLGVPGEVECGGAKCDLTKKEVCCVSTAAPFDAHCSTSCDNTNELELSCDGPEDCTSGSAHICCHPGGQSLVSCSASCLGQELCAKDADCAPAEYCAPGTATLGSAATCALVPKNDSVWCAGAPCDVGAGNVCCYDRSTSKETCAKSCTGASQFSIACDGPEDCARHECCSSFTGTGLYLGNYCSTVNGDGATGCAAQPGGLVHCGGSADCPGQVCCRNPGSTEPTTLCAAACDVNQTRVCATDADCVGTSCSLVTAAGPGNATGMSLCK